MTKYLLIGGRFDYDVSANSICVRNIANELLKRGNKVYSITDSIDGKNSYREQDDLTVYGVKRGLFSIFIELLKDKGPFYSALFKIISFIRSIVLIPFYPVVERIRYLKLFNLSDRIVKNESIEVVICFCGHAESVYCGVNLKKKYMSSINVVNYHLDILSQRSRKIIESKILQKKIRSFLETEFKTVDAIFLPETFENKWNLKGNIRLVGFPVCVEDDQECCEYKVSFSNKKINVVYVGSIDSVNRNPNYLIDLFSLFNEKNEKKIQLHIWGKIDELVKKNITTKDFVVYHGTLESNFSMCVLKQSDFVLNIGNAVTPRMLPSKIFKSFLSCKPILNFVKNKHDFSLPYFEKYGHSLNIFENKLNVQEDLKLIKYFFEKNIYKTFEVPRELIEPNTPRYIVNKIEELQKNDKR